MKKRFSCLLTFFAILAFICLSTTAYAEDQAVIIGFSQKPGQVEKTKIHKHRGKLKRSFRRVKAIAARLPADEIERLKADPNVSYIVPDATTMAIDPVLGGPEYDAAWGVSHIGAAEAHAQGILGSGVKVAVLDTGIDYTHPEFADIYRGGDNFTCPQEEVDPEFNNCDPTNHDPLDDSWNSHGTHVSGIIAAAKNGTGVVGVAPGVELYAGKVLGGSTFGLESWLIAGLEWAIDNQIDVVNMSLGFANYSPALEEACQAAFDAGIVLVAAAGNTYGGEVMYPAAYPTVIAVAATAPEDIVAAISSQGPTVELAAPGFRINSSIAGGTYKLMSGTSQAAPHVAGVAALILSAGVEDLTGDGKSDNRDVRLKLQNTAKDLGEAGRDTLSGYGLVTIDLTAPPGSPFPIRMTVSKVRRSIRDSIKTAVLENGLFSITIDNDSLRGMIVKVCEDGLFRPDLSKAFRFRRNRLKESHLTLEATDKTYDVFFIPFGRNGSSADVTIQQAL